MKTIYTYIEFVRTDKGWDALNRFMKVAIGSIEWSPAANEYIYLLNENYWHKCKCLSTTNMKDILTFINRLKKPEDVRFPKP